MPSRGPQTFKKRQKEQQRKERQQEKMAQRQARKGERPAVSTEDQSLSRSEGATTNEPADGIAAVKTL